MIEARKTSLPKLSIKTEVSQLPSPDASPISTHWNERSKEFEQLMTATKSVTVDTGNVWQLAYSDPDYIKKDLQELEKGIVLFMKSDFDAVATFFGTHRRGTIHTSLGYMAIQFCKAFMSFDPAEIESCFYAIEECIQVCTMLRKKGSSMWSSGGASGSTAFKDMSLVEKHAEITFATALFMKSILSIFHNLTMGTLVREGLKMRASYQICKAGYTYLDELYASEGASGFQKQGINEHFVAGVLFGVGGFNMVLSMIPSSYLKICKLAGFSGDRQFGISCLEVAARWKRRDYSIIYSEGSGTVVPFDLPDRTLSLPSLPSLFSDWALLTVHGMLSPTIPIPETDLSSLSSHIRMRVQEFPESIAYTIFEARLLDIYEDGRGAERLVVKVVKQQRKWATFVVGGMWALGYIRASQGKLEQAAGW
jgi:hypothetical protein